VQGDLNQPIKEVVKEGIRGVIWTTGRDRTQGGYNVDGRGGGNIPLRKEGELWRREGIRGTRGKKGGSEEGGIHLSLFVKRGGSRRPVTESPGSQSFQEKKKKCSYMVT